MNISIEIDNDKCVGPLDCGECMRICPTSAFRTYPSKERVKGEMIDKWLLDYIPFECAGCEKCSEVCQVGAIKLVMA